MPLGKTTHVPRSWSSAPKSSVRGRSESASDLIFSGTESRWALGKAVEEVHLGERLKRREWALIGTGFENGSETFL